MKVWEYQWAMFILISFLPFAWSFQHPSRYGFGVTKNEVPIGRRFETVSPIHIRLTEKGRTSTALRLDIPLIGADDSWGNIAALTGTAAVSQVLGKRTKIGKLLGPPVTAMAVTFALASVGLLNPGGTSTAKALQLLSLQLATPLILLGADLRDCVSRCGPLLLSFLVASIATTVACLAGWSLTGNMLTKSLGKDGLIIAAALMAKNIGGGINYIAVCRSLSASPQAVAAGLCVDNIFALVYFPLTSALSSGMPDIDQSKTMQEPGTALNETISEAPSSSNVQTALTAIFVSTMLLWLGERIAGASGALPCCTVLTALFASWAPKSFIVPLQSTAEVLGTVCLYLFFATAGAPGIAVAESVKASLIPLTLFLTMLYSVHGIILGACYKLFGKRFSAFKPQRLLVASSAAIGGPATSLALAQANQWESLRVPSLLVGNIGYVVATFSGLAYFALLRQ